MTGVDEENVVRITSESHQGLIVRDELKSYDTSKVGVFRDEEKQVRIVIQTPDSMIVGEKEITDRAVISQVHEVMRDIGKDGRISAQESDQMFNISQDLLDEGRLNCSVPNVLASGDKPQQR